MKRCDCDGYLLGLYGVSDGFLRGNNDGGNVGIFVECIDGFILGEMVGLSDEHFIIDTFHVYLYLYLLI